MDMHAYEWISHTYYLVKSYNNCAHCTLRLRPTKCVKSIMSVRVDGVAKLLFNMLKCIRLVTSTHALNLAVGIASGINSRWKVL